MPRLVWQENMVLLTSMSPTGQRPRVVPVNPEAGVAWTFRT